MKKGRCKVELAKFPIVILVVLGFLTVALTPAAAEWFGDLHLGVASTEDAEITRSAFGASVTEREDFGSSFAIGLRIGYWLEELQWLGFSVDYSDFAVRLLERGVYISPLSGLLMLRICGIRSADFPKGRLQPYLALGLGIFYSVEKGSYVPPPWGPLVTAGNRDASIDFGVDLRMGVSWSFTKNLSLFGEYRYTRVEPELGGGPFGEDVTIEAVLRTRHWLTGITFYFN